MITGKKIHTILFILILLLVCAQTLSAIPIPYGVDGIIYDLDGITQVPKDIPFSVVNENSGSEVYGKTGHGSSGRYAASLSGSVGDTITITAWNAYNNASLSLILDGVIRDAHFLLNMTYPPLPPTITTTTLPAATEDSVYSAFIEAVDENNDPLTYSLLTPIGLFLNQSTGTLAWTPDNDDVANHTIMIQVNDGIHFVNQSFVVEVINVNDPPSIFSLPPPTAIEDTPYYYQIDALDVDSQTLEYTLITGPALMTVNLTSGLLSWQPTNSDVGNHSVVIEVTDGEIATQQLFSIQVSNVNDLPFITSFPVTTAIEDEDYIYLVEAEDIDNDTLHYDLLSSPLGMSIQPTTGIITWLPQNHDVGFHNVTVSVSDNNASVYQAYSLLVENVNDPPLIVSTPPPSTRVGQRYVYTLNVTDPDNDALSIVLVQGPSNAILDATGVLTWIPTTNHIGNHSFTIEVHDGNLTTTQTFTVQVNPPLLITTVFASSAGFANPTSNSQNVLNLSIGNNIVVSGIESDTQDEFIVTDAIRQSLIGALDNASVNVRSSYDHTIETLSEKPPSLPTVGRKVFTYVEITSENRRGALVSFKVDKSWIVESGITAQDISLFHFSNGAWEELDTTLFFEQQNQTYYHAYASHFSFFAIAVRQGVDADYSFEPKISRISLTYTFKGTVYFSNGRQVETGTVVEITNLNTSTTVSIPTGVGPYTGGYIGSLQGKIGDHIDIRVGNEVSSHRLGEDTLITVDLTLTEDGLNKITGYSIITVMNENRLTSGALLFFLLVLGILIVRKKLKR